MLKVEERLRLKARRQMPPLTCAQPGSTVPQPASPDARRRTYELGHSAVIRDAFAERVLWNIRPLKQPHCGLMLAARITLPRFSVSSAMSLPKSAGEPVITVPPRSASRAFIVGSARAALISLLSLSTISAGVAFGAPTPDQALASYPGRNSLTVGRSGSPSQRVAVVTANGRSLPALICSIVSDVEPNRTCTCPPSRSVITGPPPRYGT